MDNGAEHVVIWGDSESGSYTAKSGYKWLTQNHSSHDTRNEQWSWLWKLPILENMKHFLWLALHESLPTNSFLVKRHIFVDSSCNRCGATEETILHTIRDCPLARMVWLKLQVGHNKIFANANATGWIRSNLAGTQSTLFAVSCWVLWKAHNNEVFNDQRWTIWYILNQIIATKHSILRSFMSKPQRRNVREGRWFPPPMDTVKLNVDGSSRGNPRLSGIGGVLWNYEGEWLTGFAGFIGITTNINAELLAIFNDQKLAWSMEIRSIMCESDLEVAWSWISNGVPHTHPHRSLVSRIQSYKNLPWQLTFRHTLREANGYVDWLAKHGALSIDTLCLWDSCPIQLASNLLADAIGVVSLRL